MRLYRYMTPTAQELQAQNNETLLNSYRKLYDQAVVRIGQLERELADNAELARRANNMADQQNAGIDALIGDLQITTIERVDGDLL